MSIFFAAIAATLCGGGATIGSVSFMHTTGIVVFAGLIGVVINQIFSGLYIAGRVHNIKNVYSVGDLFGLYYGRAGRLVSSIVCFFFCLGLYGVQILAMGAILQTAVGIDLIPAALISSVTRWPIRGRRYARRNHDRCSAVCDHYHRREPVRVSRHRPSRRLRRHDGDP